MKSIYFDESSLIDFNGAIDENIGFLDYVEEYGTVCFRLKLPENDIQKIKNAVLESMSVEDRNARAFVFDAPDMQFEFTADVAIHSFEKTCFSVTFKSSEGWVGYNIDLSEELEHSLRAEITEYLASIGTSLEGLLKRAKEKLLLSFMIEKGTFFCYGDVSVRKEEQDGTDCPILELSDVYATRLNADGVAVWYSPTETTWSGVRFKPGDMVTSVIHTLITRDAPCEVSYIHPKLQEVLDFYRGEREMVGAVSFPRRLLKDGDKVFTLSLVTDKWAYYSHYVESEMYQYNTEKSSGNCSLHLIADGFFAEQGCCESALGIKRGEEQLLYSNEGWTTYFESVKE